MNKILVTVDYTDFTGRYYLISSIKNKVVHLNVEDSIHVQISKLLYDVDYCKLSYNNKPQSNIMIDTPNGDSKALGYVYRGSTEMDGKRANFDVWVTIHKVTDFEIELLN